MKIVVSPRGSIEYGVRAKYHLVELSIFPSYCCAAHQSVKSNNRKGEIMEMIKRGRDDTSLRPGCYKIYIYAFANSLHASVLFVCCEKVVMVSKVLPRSFSFSSQSTKLC